MATRCHYRGWSWNWGWGVPKSIIWKRGPYVPCLEGGPGQGACTVKFNASWVMVTRGSPQQIDACENITFPQLCWWVVKMTKTTSYPESCSTKMFTGTIEMLQRGHILKVNCCLKVQNAHVNSESDVLLSTNLPYTNLTVIFYLLEILCPHQ